MTLVVGILCSDGIVVGTDSAVTFTTPVQTTIGQTTFDIEQPTIEQPRRKIEIIQDKVIVAGSGQIGVRQRIVDIVRKGWNDKKMFTEKGIDVGRALSHESLVDFNNTGAKGGSYQALIAAPCAGKHELIEFEAKNFQPEVKDHDNWYTSMGSGQPVADTLLGLVRKAFWGDDPPNLQDGIFAATMVLKLGCEMTPVGVAAPIQMAVLDKNKKGFSARLLPEDELSCHETDVDSAIEYFGKYRLSDTDAKAVPKSNNPT